MEHLHSHQDFPPSHVPVAASAPETPKTFVSVASFASLLDDVNYLKPEDIELLKKAYRFADTAHLGQLRCNGEPYITHPIAVTRIASSWKLDVQALIAALLHDVIEDCEVSYTELIEHFGSTVTNLVDGLTKIDKLNFSTREEGQSENFRKMLLAMAQDVRVILIKLADRTHNMRTLGDMPPEKWGRIASETLEIYVPIALRLGLHQTYRELQDLAFQYLYPWRYQTINKALGTARKRRKDLIQTVQEKVKSTFSQSPLTINISGREKTVYSIYKKMNEKNMSFSQVNDIYGFRVTVPHVTDCYTALGILHQMYQPIPGRFKDYIAIPKVNGYQSLHTTLLGPAGLQIEFQFRTEVMNTVAESGVAAHWQYKVENTSAPAKAGAAWLQSLLEIQNETRDAAEFWNHIKVDLFPDEVYVCTPKGQVMSMPRGATVVDFAYAIHTDLGDHVISATINGNPTALRSELHNGDTVEIMTSSVAHPNPAWLGFATTGRARSQIRSFLRQQAHDQSQQLGEKFLQQAMRAEGILHTPTQKDNKPLWDKLLHFTGNQNIEELMIDIGLGKKAVSLVAKRLVLLLSEQGVRPDALLLSRERFTSHETLSQGTVSLDGSENKGTVQYASCCLPLPEDAIVGYMGHGEGLQIHRTSCNIAQRLQGKDKERFIHVEWADEPQRLFRTTLQLTINAGMGGLAKIASIIARNEADITQISTDLEQQLERTSEMRIELFVRNLSQQKAIVRSLERSDVVSQVLRLTASEQAHKNTTPL